ncbi:hypothetical protein HDV06_002767 [Boothiomyces sp. JEL0866]|nr:hypothetical protein HDV06_002767 [Boothiomyces sp. JEL0866]
MFKYLAVSASALALVPTGLTADFTLPDNKVLFNKYFGKGTQNYKCNGTVWALDSANADLFLEKDYTGPAAITHFFLPPPGDAKGGRPTWKYNADGSQVTGIVTKKINAPSATDIQWLYVNETSSTTNTGVMDNIDFIFRLYTVAGLAPAASGCTTGNAGNITKVPYEAQYWFYKPNNSGVAPKTTTATANLQPVTTAVVATTKDQYYGNSPTPVATTGSDSYGDAPVVTTSAPTYPVLSSANKIAGSLIGFLFLLFA